MASGFLLSILSPVWRAKLCGEIGASEGRVLMIDADDEKLFWKVVALGCGESVTSGSGREAGEGEPRAGTERVRPDYRLRFTY